MKANHDGKQLTSLDRALGPVYRLNHVRVMQLYNRYLQSRVVLNNRSPSRKQPWVTWVQLQLRKGVAKHGGTTTSSETNQKLARWLCRRDFKWAPPVPSHSVFIMAACRMDFCHLGPQNTLSKYFPTWLTSIGTTILDLENSRTHCSFWSRAANPGFWLVTALINVLQ